MVEIFDLALTAVIDSFEIYTINSLTKKKNSETHFIMSKALFAKAQQKLYKVILLLRGSTSVMANFRTVFLKIFFEKTILRMFQQTKS